MIALDNADKIQGDASAATVVDYTLHGLDNNVIKQLAAGQLASGIGDLYTADSVDVVATITLVNTDSSARTVNLYLLPSGGTARRLIPKDLSLGIGYSLHTDGKSVVIMSPAGGQLSAYAAHQTTHSPNDGDDALDCAAAAEISVVVGSSEGSADTLSRADHVHAISHAITDNHLLTVDGTVNDGEYLKATANGAEGKTFAEAQTDLFSVAMPENSNIEFVNALSADGKWSGIVTKQFNGGATIPFGEIVYLKALDSEWYQAKADVTATSGAVMVGIVVLATTDGNPCTVLLQGKVRADAKFPTFTISAPVFISAATAGLLTSTAPTGTTNFVVRIIGHAGTGDELYVHPDNSYVELA